MSYFNPTQPYDQMSFRVSEESKNLAIKYHNTEEWFIYCSCSNPISADTWVISASDEKMEQMVQDGIIDRLA